MDSQSVLIERDRASGGKLERTHGKLGMDWRIGGLQDRVIENMHDLMYCAFPACFADGRWYPDILQQQTGPITWLLFDMRAVDAICCLPHFLHNLLRQPHSALLLPLRLLMLLLIDILLLLRLLLMPQLLLLFFSCIVLVVHEPGNITLAHK